MGKVAYIMNTLDRALTTYSVTEQNLGFAGSDIHSMYINDQGSKEDLTKFFNDMAAKRNVILRQNPDNIGNPQAFNIMCEAAARTHDYICIMSNDILMKPNWLKKALEVLQHDDIGLVGFCWRSYQCAPFTFHGHRVVEEDRIFGCWVLRSDTWRKVGYFSQFSKYGLWDSDYNIRTQLAGYRNVYLKDYESEHLITDAGSTSPYRNMKNEELSKATTKYNEMVQKYSEDCYYITKDQRLKCKPRVKGI